MVLASSLERDIKVRTCSQQNGTTCHTSGKYNYFENNCFTAKTDVVAPVPTPAKAKIFYLHLCICFFVGNV